MSATTTAVPPPDRLPGREIGGGAGGEGVAQEVVAVPRRDDRHEQLTAPDQARVDGGPVDGHVGTDERAARRAGHRRRLHPHGSYTRTVVTLLVLLFGGRSAEHEVSCVTAAHVLAAADPARYDVVAVGITRDGDWVRAEPAPDALVAEGPAVDFEATHHVTPRQSCSPCSTAPSARTAPCRAGWSWPACRTSAPACWARRSAWTRPWPRRCWPRPASPRCATGPSATSRSTTPPSTGWPTTWACRCS